ncbi:hypothetical protein D3C80_1500020 [compost metagenome]
MQSISLVLTVLSFPYQAKARTAIDNPIKYGLAGSIHEKLAAMLLLPASNAITGVIQQREAERADKIPTLVNVPNDFKRIIL